MGYHFWLLVAGWAAFILAIAANVEAWRHVARLRRKVNRLPRELRESMELTAVAADQAEAELERLKELTDHLSEAIGIMQKSRDQWKDMFFVQAHEHGNGQAMLERALTRNREMVRKLVASVNSVRKAEGLAPITKVDQLDDPPIGTADGYRDAMKALSDKAPPDPDMVAERDRLLDEARSDDDEAEPSQPQAD
jgi:hypothetical protein